jgi:pantoate--beta-alanine ligase
MKTVTSVKQMQTVASGLKRKFKTIAFVPTMGYLHDGHLSLVRMAKKRADVVIASIFVNPTQFAPHEDLARYPRDAKGDLAKLKKLGVDFVFVPQAKDMYPEGFQTLVEVREVSQGLCGTTRPGHFQGVATVVLKLFNIVSPDVAIFGKKDYQQWLVLKAMARDLNLRVNVVGAPIVREQDGLAMSSRNAYLSAEDRRIALCLPRGLKAAAAACRAEPGLPAAKIRAAFLKEIPLTERVVLDYFECVDANTLKPLVKHAQGKTLLAAAIFVGTTRLIDNVTV